MDHQQSHQRLPTERIDGQVMTGSVAAYFISKGYGFIECSDKGTDVFVHQSAIQSPGFRYLQSGQQVKFTLQMRNGKPCALDVTGLNGPIPFCASKKEVMSLIARTKAAQQHAEASEVKNGAVDAHLQDPVYIRQQPGLQQATILNMNQTIPPIIASPAPSDSFSQDQSQILLRTATGDSAGILQAEDPTIAYHSAPVTYMYVPRVENNRIRTGRVKWFDPTKKYGFIFPSHCDGEVYVKQKNILTQDQVLHQDQMVEYVEEVASDGKMWAIQVRPIVHVDLPVHSLSPLPMRPSAHHLQAETPSGQTILVPMTPQVPQVPSSLQVINPINQIDQIKQMNQVNQMPVNLLSSYPLSHSPVFTVPPISHVLDSRSGYVQQVQMSAAGNIV